MAFAGLLSALYPTKCALCATIDADPVCEACREAMLRLPAEVTAEDGPVSRRASVMRYEGRAAQAVQRLKYERVTSHAAWMAAQIGQLAELTGLDTVDAVVPVPIHWSRRNWRGFNQADLLAENLPAVRRDLLKRIRATRPQVGLTTDDRLTNLTGAFEASPECRGCSILLVDDVTTSGGTAKECAKTLLAQGALEVFLITFAAGDDPT